MYIFQFFYFCFFFGAYQKHKVTLATSTVDAPIESMLSNNQLPPESMKDLSGSHQIVKGPQQQTKMLQSVGQCLAVRYGQ